MHILVSIRAGLLAMMICVSAPSASGRPAGGEDRTQVSGTARQGAVKIEELGIRLGMGELREPLAVAVDQRACVYVADAMTGKIFRYSPDGGSIEFEGPSASLYPLDLGVEGSMVYVLDYTGNRVLRYDASGAFLDVLLSFDQFGGMHPVSFTAGGGGRFITTDIEHHSMTVWTPLLEIEFTTGEYGWTAGSFDDPRKAATLPDGGLVVVESGNRRLQVLSATGMFERIIEPPDQIPFLSPRWVASDGKGNIFVADTGAGALFVFDREGSFLVRIDSYGGEEIIPASAAIGWDDRLYVADLRSKSLLVYRLDYR